MNLQEKSESISNYIRQCGNIIHQKGHQVAGDYELTLDQYHLLVYLSILEEPPTIGHIADEFNRAQNTISEKISRLEEKELAKKIDDEFDRRVTRVIITEKGEHLIHTIKLERSNKSIHIALSKMEEWEVDNLLNYLTKLYNSLEKGV